MVARADNALFILNKRLQEEPQLDLISFHALPRIEPLLPQVACCCRSHNTRLQNASADMLDTVFEMDEDELATGVKVIRSSDIRMLERGMCAISEAVQVFQQNGSTRPVEHEHTRGEPPDAPSASGGLPRANSQRTPTPSPHRNKISGQCKTSDHKAADSNRAATGLPPTASPGPPETKNNKYAAPPTSPQTWEDNLRRSLRRMRLDEEQRLLDRRESLQIEIPASPRSPLGLRISGLQTPTLPAVAGPDGGGSKSRGGTVEAPYARSGPYQLVYANSTLQDLHHQIDDSTRFMHSILKIGSQSRKQAEKSQATRSSEAIKGMLCRLERACERVLKEKELVASEMESRAPEEKWKNMLDSVVTMTSALGANDKVDEEG